MIKKQAFTLIEILVSIALFAIIILFLFQTLDMTKKTNSFYSHKLEDFKSSNKLKKLLFLDLIKQQKKIIIGLGKDDNTILQLQSTNFYHNPFYSNITYLITKKKNLVRIESLHQFNSKKLNDDFFTTSFVDRVDNNISKFKVSQKDNKIFFYIEKENNQKILFSF